MVPLTSAQLSSDPTRSFIFPLHVAPAVSTLDMDAINLGLSDCALLETWHLQLIINSL